MRTQKQVAARMSATAEIAFKKQLVAAREAAGLSQRRLADLMGVSNSTISRMERLDSDPTMSDLRQYLTQCKAALSISVIDSRQVADRWLKAEVSPAMLEAGFQSRPEAEDSSVDWVIVGSTDEFGLAA